MSEYQFNIGDLPSTGAS